jgi:iron complex outermembrane receptor protein
MSATDIVFIATLRVIGAFVVTRDSARVGFNILLAITALTTLLCTAKAATPEAPLPLADSAAGAAGGDAGGDSGQLESVTVTARRREENVQDVPIPITVLGGNQLESLAQFRLEDLNQHLPSTNVLFQNPRQASIAVRGLGNNPANDALESSVGVYLDNVYLGRPGMANFDLVDIDQVSLLRGPQGTLFGKNTTGGVLDITTLQPTFKPQATLETSFGNLGYYQVRGAVAGGITDDLAGRFSFAKTYRQGFIDDPVNGLKYNGTNRDGFRGQLLYQPTETFHLRLIADYNSEDEDCCISPVSNLGPGGLLQKIASTGAVFAFDPNFRTTYINSFQHMTASQGGYSAEANWDVGESKLTSITAYRYWRFHPNNDADDASISAISDAGQNVNDRQFSQELRWASPGGRTLEYVTGLYYFYQAQNNFLETQYGPDAGAWLGVPVFDDAYTSTLSNLHLWSGSAFAQGTWNVTSALSLTAGLRETYEYKATRIFRTAPVGPSPALPLALPEYNSGNLERSDSDPSGLLSASYKLTPDVLTYVSFAHGAKSGGVNPAVPPSVAGGLPATATLFIAPERANDYELGIKSQWLDKHVQLNADLFWTDVNNYQATSTGIINGVSTQILGNVGKVRTRGVEVELAATPLEGLTLALNASFNDARYREYPNAPCNAAESAAGLKVCSLTGLPIFEAPRWIANPNADYRFKVGQLTLFSDVGYSWRSQFYGASDDSALTLIPGYGLLNAKVGVGGSVYHSEWSLSVWTENALDKNYFTSIGRGNFGEYYGTPGLPRTYGATLRLDF